MHGPLLVCHMTSVPHLINESLRLPTRWTKLLFYCICLHKIENNMTTFSSDIDFHKVHCTFKTQTFYSG